MKTIDFSNVEDVRLNSVDIFMIEYGSTRVWPTGSVIALNLAGTAAEARGIEFDQNYSVSSPMATFTLASGCISIDIGPWTDSALSNTFTSRAIWISLNGSPIAYGLSGVLDSISFNHNYVQARYGGLWHLPKVTKPGDKLSLMVGDEDGNSGFSFECAVITFS